MCSMVGVALGIQLSAYICIIITGTFFIRASMASTKDSLDLFEKKFQINRQNMTKQAKKAAKLEKKLKVLTGGYQSRAVALSKQLNDIHEQCEQSFIEMNTFKLLQEVEGQAIPRRLEVIKCM